MSSQRASFSRLKEVLPVTPAPAASPEGPILEETPAAAVVPAPASAPAVQPAAVQPVAVQQKAASVTVPVVVAAPPVLSPSRSALAARPGKRLQHTKPATFRLPIELIEALKDVAQHNNLNMTDIVAEAVWLHLANFQWPGGMEARREILAAHFAPPPAP